MIRIGLLSTDERLIDELTNIVYKQPLSWLIRSAPQELEDEGSDEPFAYLILSDRYLDFASVEEWVDRFQAQYPASKIILLLSNYHDAAVNGKYLSMCKMKQVDYVLPGHGTATIADQINAWVDHGGADKEMLANRGKIITFVGSTPNIGTTLTSFGVAFRLAMETKARIGYLCLNLKSSKLHKYLGRDERVFSLDSLRAELKAQSLSDDRLLQVCEPLREAPGLHVLYGNMLREQAEFFTAVEIEHLLRAARSAFDVCIVEVNAYWDNAATICGIVEADTRVVVTTGDIAHFQEDMNKWIRQVGSVFGLQSHAFELIAVQMGKTSSDTLTVKDIRKETQMHLVGSLSRHEDAVALLNRGKLTEMLSGGHPMQLELTAIAQKIIELYQLPRKVLIPKKPWLKRILAGSAAT
jgi:Flp pilus assembly CpaE family ATPase